MPYAFLPPGLSSDTARSATKKHQCLPPPPVIPIYLSPQYEPPRCRLSPPGRCCPRPRCPLGRCYPLCYPEYVSNYCFFFMVDRRRKQGRQYSIDLEGTEYGTSQPRSTYESGWSSLLITNHLVSFWIIFSDSTVPRKDRFPATRKAAQNCSTPSATMVDHWFVTVLATTAITSESILHFAEQPPTDDAMDTRMRAKKDHRNESGGRSWECHPCI
jgi:hypothetical protein